MKKFGRKFKKWRSIRKLAVDLIQNGMNSTLVSDFSYSINQDKQSSNLFLLFHHGTYFIFPYIAINRMKYNGACFLISENSFDKKTIEQLATSLDIPVSIEYIDSNGFFVRRAKKLINKNYAVFLLIDIPYGNDVRSNVNYDCSFGTLLLKNGYLRVVKSLNQKITLMTSSLNLRKKQMDITIKTFKDEDEINNFLHMEYKKKPEMFERFHHLKKICAFKNLNEKFTYKFKSNNKKYTYSPTTEKISTHV